MYKYVHWMTLLKNVKKADIAVLKKADYEPSCTPSGHCCAAWCPVKRDGTISTIDPGGRVTSGLGL
jgi:hypothetical protein